MNRIVLTGVALFFALVGIALIGGADKAVASHGCGGCSGNVCSGDDCSSSCKGRLLGGLRCHGRTRCCGKVETCCGEAPAPAPVCEPAPACCGKVEKCCGKVRRERCHGRDRCCGRQVRTRCCGAAPACPTTCCG